MPGLIMSLKVKLNDAGALAVEKSSLPSTVTELAKTLQIMLVVVLLQPEYEKTGPAEESLQFDGNAITRDPVSGRVMLELGVIVNR